MNKVGITWPLGLLVALLALPACGAGGDDKDADENRDAGPSSSAGRDSGTNSGGTDAAASNPIGDLINTILGDGGLSGIGNLLGDGGLSGIGNLLGDAGLSGLAGLFGDGGLPDFGSLLGDGGFPNFGDGGFDPAIICARAPQFCPDAGSPVDAGSDHADAGPSDAGSSADASDSGTADAGS
jgi:hypothetical protein